ncbi:MULTISPECIES: RHS domain-containing protein [Gammaproteobacteria]|nr:hypothetical protein [Salmonella enterica]EDZ1538572.1 hypothetical protein [Salmonella enterica subsp. enterica serovar Derby]EEX4872035.1 hypothetical protein [Salmonella enterica subsp. enterica serovar 4,[5],12:i:-]EKO3572629.1 RHS domain-containing protein [Vibrio metschnikovii]ELA0894230.1 RHS domain-containing protein [Klebsiella pneumoniae]NBF26748.1 hypothetical protein [Enterobacter hormaechei]HBN5549716.1 RHS domain-containing protein [Proteus mirabilis]HCQ6743948.1 RHS domain-
MVRRQERKLYHLGTPKALTDVSGQVVWKASHHRVSRERDFWKSIVL